MARSPSIKEFNDELRRRNAEASDLSGQDQLDSLRHDVLVLQLGFRSMTRTLEKMLRLLEQNMLPAPVPEPMPEQEPLPGDPPPPPEAA